MSTKQKIQIIITSMLLCVVPILKTNAQWIKTNSFVSPHHNLAYPHPTAAYGSGGSGEIYKSIDSGYSWNLIHDFGPFTTTQSILFLNADTGYVQQFHRMYRTTDGGQTWQALPDLFAPAFSLNNTLNIKNIGNTLYISAARGDTSFVFQSQDLGSTFTIVYQEIISNAEPMYVSFYTATDAYLIHPKNDSTVFVTHNNFASIDTLLYNNGTIGSEVVMSFVDSNYGFLFGRSGAQSAPKRLWRNPLHPQSMNMLPLALDNTGILPALDMELGLTGTNSRVYACSEYGKIFWSQNFGQYWNEQQTPVNTTVQSIAFATPNLGIALTGQGAIYTKNGGDFPNSIIDQTFSDAIKLYPNPASNVLYFEIENDQDIEGVRILNLNGQELLQSNLNTKSISIQSLSSGSYQIIFEGKNGKKATKRFMKQ